MSERELVTKVFEKSDDGVKMTIMKKAKLVFCHGITNFVLFLKKQFFIVAFLYLAYYNFLSPIFGKKKNIIF